ncbi:hypothetical protein [Streptomyces sp. H27-D2]|uniref:hypothetical protein n=1 Tax=Streptomyces sp. H27-D2 TaxID=3046304 RepID=UPI002DB912D8|nr:hypothetical protein [Streptomyces sp. H27-D2]MEC4016441.1 hypothetical protein [Streptomyces sp. H27-D2]
MGSYGADAGGQGYALLIAAAPVGRHRLMDAVAALPALAAVPPGVLTGNTETGAGASVVQLVDPTDPNAVLTHLRTAAATPGPLVVHLAGQLTVDPRQLRPHLALARTTPATTRYTALPWHWLAAELRERAPGSTVVLADLVADPAVWKRVGELRLETELLEAGVAVYGVLSPPPVRRRIAAPEYSRALARSLRGASARPPLERLHQEAVAEAGLADTDALLLAAEPSPAGGRGPGWGDHCDAAGDAPGGADGYDSSSRSRRTEHADGHTAERRYGYSDQADHADQGERPPRSPASAEVPALAPGYVRASAPTAPLPVPLPVPLPLPAPLPVLLPIPAPAPVPADEVRPPARDAEPAQPPVRTPEPASSLAGGSPSSVPAPAPAPTSGAAVGAALAAVRAAPPAPSRAASPPPPPAPVQAVRPLPPVPLHAPDVASPAAGQSARGQRVPRAAPENPLTAILATARAGRRNEAADMVSAWEQQALRRHGANSLEVALWIEVRAELARLAGETARSAELWAAVAAIRLSCGQAPGDPDVEGAVDRAHHQWQQVTDPVRARELAPDLIALRRRVPGRKQGALEAAQRRLQALRTAGAAGTAAGTTGAV